MSQHHWIGEAWFLKVHSSHVARGLIGVPMLDIALTISGDKKIRQLRACG
jgi:lipopolysaccharide transport system ATP-binding protein